jgi:hypothetical protein
MRIVWVVQTVPADGVITGDYVVVGKLSRALAALGAESAIVPARDARAHIERNRPDRVVVHGFLQQDAWDWLSRLGDRLPTVFWWCTMHFSPTWGEDVIRPSRFTAIATNSELALSWLRAWGGHRTLLLQSATSEDDAHAPFDPALAHPVVFLGIGRHKHEAQEAMVLRPAADLGLAVYGARWDGTPWAPYWQGPLPIGREASLYRSCRVVLGMTERTQAAAGMINNRPFDALAAGAACVMPHYPALEALFGDRLLYTTSADDTRRLVAGVLDGTIRPPDARDWILANHTYRHRAEQLMGLLARL